MYMTRGKLTVGRCPTGKDYIQYWNKDDAGRKVRQDIYMTDGHHIITSSGSFSHDFFTPL